MAYAVRFPAFLTRNLEQTWRFDKSLRGDSPWDYFDVQRSIIERQEPLNAILDAYLSEGDVVLEAGCGSGRWVNHLDRKGYRSVGVDISRRIVGIVKWFDPDARVLTGDVLSLPVKSEAFDAVLASYMFEHFKDRPVHALGEACRVLKPGGILFFVVPYNSLLRLLVFNRLMDLACYYYQPRTRRERLIFHEYRFSRKECRRFLQQAGFEVVEFDPDEYLDGWNRGVTVDYRNLQFYWPRLADLPDDYQLPGWAQRITSSMLKIYPWSCCGGIICVARKPKRVSK